MKLKTYKSATSVAVEAALKKASFADAGILGIGTTDDDTDCAEREVYALPVLPPSPATPVDGRPSFKYDAVAIVSTFRAQKRRLPVDLNHDTEFANYGLQGRAVGWILDLFIADDGCLYAWVEATPEGDKLLDEKQFGYTSPTLFIDEAGDAVQLKSLALTNNPALLMPSIFDAADIDCNTDCKPSDCGTIRCDDASADADAYSAESGTPAGLTAVTYSAEQTAEAFAQVSTLKAQLEAANTQITALTAERDTLTTSVQTLTAERDDARNQLTAFHADAKAKAITAAVEDAIKSGKATPAQRASLEAFAKADFDGFKAFVAAAPVIGIAQPSTFAATAPTAASVEDAVTAELADFLKKNGMTVADYQAGQALRK